MCGITGYSNLSCHREILQASLSSLAHRGPDSKGIWQGEEIGLGHARLSVIDLSPNANQPMGNEDDTVKLVANGEIYDFQSLTRELITKGHTFRSSSDSEVLLHGYEEWGVEGILRRINGMFAFALADAGSDELLLARDRIGIKPLYYWSDGTALAFASELPALKKLIPAPLEIDEYARDCYFTFGYIPGERTVYRNCFKLLPGHFLRWHKRELTLQRYWSPPLPEENPDFSLDELHQLLQDSVGIRLVSDRPLGTFLSGGIDSSLVTAIAAQQTNRLRTFSIGFEYADCNESEYARAVASHLGTEHTELFCTEKEATDIIPRLPEIYGEPFADPSAIPTVLLSQLTRENTVVALSGDGGDELCLGYRRYEQSAKTGIASALTAPEGLAGFVSNLLGPDSYIAKLAKATTVSSVAEATLLTGGIFHHLFFDRLLGHRWNSQASQYYRLFEKVKDYSLDVAWSWVDLQHYLVEDILAKVDRASMSVALEVRVPLLDHRIVELLTAAPRSVKIRGGCTKWALKELLSNYIPENLWNRPKQGFSPPVGKWLSGTLNEMLRDYLAADTLRNEGIFKVDYVQQLISDHEAGKKDNQYYLWTLLMWEMWRRDSA